jgi:subtilisin family serine protease
MIWTTSKGGRYIEFNGTSAAAPFAAGVAATIYARFATAGITRDATLAARVKEKLRTSVDDLGQPGWDPLYGWGRINAALAQQGGF